MVTGIMEGEVDHYTCPGTVRVFSVPQEVWLATNIKAGDLITLAIDRKGSEVVANWKGGVYGPGFDVIDVIIP